MNKLLGVKAAALVAAAAAVVASAFYNKKANQDAANAGSASAEAAAKLKTQQLHLFFQICGITNYFQGVRNFRNYRYDAKPVLLQSLTSKHPNLPLLLERIKGKKP